MSEATNYQFKIYLHLAVFHFDEIFGPQLLQIYPDTIDRKEQIRMVLQKLIDVGSLHDKKEWEFLYSDRYFSSQNVYLSLPNMAARGGYTDFMIALIISPTYSNVVSSMAMDWNSVFELKLNIMDSLTEAMLDRNMDKVRTKLEFILSSNIESIKENVAFQLDILSPGSFEIL